MASGRKGVKICGGEEAAVARANGTPSGGSAGRVWCAPRVEFTHSTAGVSFGSGVGAVG
jgi:hypothetical protein